MKQKQKNLLREISTHSRTHAVAHTRSPAEEPEVKTLWQKRKEIIQFRARGCEWRKEKQKTRALAATATSKGSSSSSREVTAATVYRIVFDLFRFSHPLRVYRVEILFRFSCAQKVTTFAAIRSLLLSICRRLCVSKRKICNIWANEKFSYQKNVIGLNLRPKSLNGFCEIGKSVNYAKLKPRKYYSYKFIQNKQTIMSSNRTLSNSFTLLCLVIVPFLFVLPNAVVKCQFVNRPPYFVPGSGDMARFSLSENTPIDSPVYQLRGKEVRNGSRTSWVRHMRFCCDCLWETPK